MRNPASVIRLMAIMAFCVFSIELLLMALLAFVPPMPVWQEALLDAGLLTILLTPPFLVFLFRPLLQNISDRAKLEVQLREANTKLESTVKERTQELEKVNEMLGEWVQKLKTRTDQQSLLAEMAELLLVATSSDEAFDIIGRYVSLIFPESSGALSIIKSSRDQVERVASWGSVPLCREMFEPDDCWALRRGKAFFAHEGDNNGLICGHHSLTSAHGKILCVPLLAQHEMVGALHITGFDQALFGMDKEAHAQAQHEFGLMMAEQIALAVSNVQLREALRHQSVRDPLTSLYNRRYMLEALEQLSAQSDRRGENILLAMIDVDHFKRFNDNHGHGAGDAVLKTVGRLFANHARSSDIVCRYGGEEFAVVLPHIEAAKGVERLESLRREVEQLEVFYRDELLPSITISIGVAFFPTDAGTIDGLIHVADEALYEAKRSGRNRLVCAASQPEGASAEEQRQGRPDTLTAS